MEGAYDTGRESRRGRKRLRAAEDPAPFEAMDAQTAARRIADLEKKMYRHASDLEFEEAARLRDEIKRVRRLGFVGA